MSASPSTSSAATPPPEKVGRRLGALSTQFVEPIRGSVGVVDSARRRHIAEEEIAGLGRVTALDGNDSTREFGNFRRIAGVVCAILDHRNARRKAIGLQADVIDALSHDAPGHSQQQDAVLRDRLGENFGGERIGEPLLFRHHADRAHQRGQWRPKIAERIAVRHKSKLIAKSRSCRSASNNWSACVNRQPRSRRRTAN